MRKKLINMVVAFAVVVLLISVSGAALAYFQFDESIGIRELVNVKICSYENEETSVITAGEAHKSGKYVKNIGQKDCYVRVKIIIPEINGKQVFEIGKGDSDNFKQISYEDKNITAKEYWEKRDDWIYYVNKSTGDKLKKRDITSDIYESICLNPLLSKDEILEFGRSANTSITIQAQCVEANTSADEAWEKFESESVSSKGEV